MLKLGVGSNGSSTVEALIMSILPPEARESDAAGAAADDGGALASKPAKREARVAVFFLSALETLG